MKKNFKVFQASAGSGKTYTIIKEYLKLCLKSKNDIDNFRNILAITFTNASANDMKAQIVAELKNIIRCDDVTNKGMASDLVKELQIDTNKLKENAQLLLTQIIHDYSSFCVSTIDSFVQKLARSFAHDLGLSSHYAVSIDENDIADTVVSNIGMEISDDNPYLVEILKRYVKEKTDKESSVNLAQNLKDFVIQLMSEKAYQRNATNQITNETQYLETLHFLDKKIEAFEQNTKYFITHFEDLIKRFGLHAEDFFQGSRSLFSLYNKLIDKKFEPIGTYAKTIIDNPCKWPSKTGKAAYESHLTQVEEALSAFLPQFAKTYNQTLGEFIFYDDQRKQLYLYAMRSIIKAEMEQLADDEGIVHISEFNKLISSVLGDFSVPFIYERLGEQYKHVFIDEFQDTSILQWQNLIPLIDNGLSNGNTSMIVGDGKQSIYRFRSGEVEQIVKLPEIHALPIDERHAAFKQYQYRLIENFDFKNLEDNYRSLSEIVNFNNRFFKELIQYLEKDETRKVYIDNGNTFGKDVKIAQNVKKGDGGLVQIDLYENDCPNDYYLGRVKEIIETLTEKRGYRYQDIAILTRKNGTGILIANFLNDNKIPIISSESILLRTSDKVLLIINTLGWLVDDTNVTTVAAILFYFNITRGAEVTGDITGYFDESKAIIEGTKTLEDVLQLASGVLRNTLTKSTCLYDLCASLIRIYGFDSIKDAFLNHLLDEIYEWQSSGKEGITEFLEYWEQKKGKLALKSSNTNAVQIMTIHKSKGLQFNVVIYPDAITNLQETSRKGKQKIWIRPEELGFDKIPNLEQVQFTLGEKCELQGEKAKQLYQAETENNRLDNCNLLYVAFTRPKQRLYILAKKSKQNTKATSEDNVIENYLKDQEKHKNTTKTEEGIRTVYQFGNPDFNITSIATSEEQNITESLSRDWFKRTKIDPMPSMFWISDKDKMQPNEWGELVHQILSGIETANDIDKALKPYLLDGSIDDETANRLKNRFMKIIENPSIMDAFSEQANVRNECEILSNGAIIRPDRYAELPDRILLIDYKTGQKKPSHALQLKTYIDALQDMVDKPISAFLVYISDDIEVEAVNNVIE